MTLSWGLCFSESPVISLVALKVPWAGAPNPNPGIGGMREWEYRTGN